MAFDKVLDIGAEGGSVFGKDASAKIGFYGATPVVQRATATTHTTTAIAVSSSFGATQLAVVQEIMNTLIACGLWTA